MENKNIETREYLIGLAMQSIISSCHYDIDTQVKDICAKSIQIADELIKSMNK